MAFTNFDTKEINCKVLYCGPSQSGKSENLRSIFASTSEEVQSGIIELQDPALESNSLFDFLPVKIGQADGYKIKLHLFTLPNECRYESLLDVLLKGVDGLVFVADSRIERLKANIDCINSIQKLFDRTGYDFCSLPKVIQYNRRDSSGLVPLDSLREALNLQQSAEQEAVAINSIGTLETLEMMTHQVLSSLTPQ